MKNIAPFTRCAGASNTPSKKSDIQQNYKLDYTSDAIEHRSCALTFQHFSSRVSLFRFSPFRPLRRSHTLGGWPPGKVPTRPRTLSPEHAREATSKSSTTCCAATLLLSKLRCFVCKWIKSERGYVSREDRTLKREKGGWLYTEKAAVNFAFLWPNAEPLAGRGWAHNSTIYVKSALSVSATTKLLTWFQAKSKWVQQVVCTHSVMKSVAHTLFEWQMIESAPKEYPRGPQKAQFLAFWGLLVCTCWVYFRFDIFACFYKLSHDFSLPYNSVAA